MLWQNKQLQEMLDRMELSNKALKEERETHINELKISEDKCTQLEDKVKMLEKTVADL